MELFSFLSPLSLPSVSSLKSVAHPKISLTIRCQVHLYAVISGNHLHKLATHSKNVNKILYKFYWLIMQSVNSWLIFSLKFKNEANWER